MRKRFPLFFILLLGVACTMTTPPKYLYKIVSSETWDLSQKEKSVPLASIDKDFVHLAEEGQVDRIAKKFFPGKKSVNILKLNTKLLPGRLVYESNPGGETKYWHLYEGSLPLNSVESSEMHKIGK